MNFKREFTERTNFALAVIPNLISFSCSSPQLVVVVPDLVAVVTTRPTFPLPFNLPMRNPPAFTFKGPLGNLPPRYLF